jgi:peptide/nickel transport system substrate-binding protein
MKSNWKRLLYFIWGLSLILLFACSNEEASAPQSENQPGQTGESGQEGNDDSKPRYGGTLKIIFQEPARNIGFPAEDAASFTLYYNLPALETLARYNEKGEITPWLAEKWEIDPDNKTITYYLKKGIKFHDGTDFNAEAVKWNIQQFLDYKRPEVKGIASMDVLDEHTLRLNLEEWDLTLLETIGYFVQMVSPTAVEENGVDWAIRNPVGTGPFVLDHWEQDVSLRFVKNENYWQEGYPYLDAIEYLFIYDRNTSANSFKAGDAHVLAHADAPTYRELEASGQYVVQHDNGFGRIGIGLMFDSANPDSPLTDVNVRRAIIHAIDPQAIVDSVLMGVGKTTNQYYVEGTRFYNPEVKGYPYDPEKAKQLLAEAGYPNGFDIPIITDAARENVITAIQSYLAQVGINADVQTVEIGQLISLTAGTWDGMTMYLRPMQPNATVMIDRNFGKNAAYFSKNIIHPERVDQLLAEARKATSFEEQAALIQELQIELIDNHAMFAPLISPNPAIFIDPVVQDLMMQKTNSLEWNPESVWLKEE